MGGGGGGGGNPLDPPLNHVILDMQWQKIHSNSCYMTFNLMFDSISVLGTEVFLTSACPTKMAHSHLHLNSLSIYKLV